MKCLPPARAAADRAIDIPPRNFVRWGAWVIAALMPGSFVILPVLWLVRQLRAPAS